MLISNKANLKRKLRQEYDISIFLRRDFHRRLITSIGAEKYRKVRKGMHREKWKKKYRRINKILRLLSRNEGQIMDIIIREAHKWLQNPKHKVFRVLLLQLTHHRMRTLIGANWGLFLVIKKIPAPFDIRPKKITRMIENSHILRMNRGNVSAQFWQTYLQIHEDITDNYHARYDSKVNKLCSFYYSEGEI